MVARLVILASLTGVLISAATPSASSPSAIPSAAPDTLAAAAKAAGRDFGVAVSARKLTDPGYLAIVDREFSTLVPESELRWDITEQSRNQFNFRQADQIVNHALATHREVHGPYLVTWSGGMPNWLLSLTTAEQIRATVSNHITSVMAHYRGKIQSWDVAAEAFNENGTRRPSLFGNRLGDSWIAEAFLTARQADPTTKLCYNDYNIENWTAPKTQAVYAMIRDFKTQGVPIDCVGLESHFLSSNPMPASFQQTIERFAALGVEVRISELDVTGSGQKQADTYAAVIRSCLAVPGCTGVTVWGVRDTDSWRSAEAPLLFDAAGEPKPAYHAVLAALRNPIKPATP